MKYLLTLKNGVIMEVSTKDITRSPVGLWKWALRQMTPQVISFVECDVLATEIAVISQLPEEVIDDYEERTIVF